MATRLALNVVQPFSNWFASIGEDLAVFGSIWLIFHHPILMLILIVCFLALVVWLIPKLLRLAKRGFQALRDRLAGSSPISRRPPVHRSSVRTPRWVLLAPANESRGIRNTMEHEKPRAQETAARCAADIGWVVHLAPDVSRALVRLARSGASDQKHILDRATATLMGMEKNREEPSALFSLLGHKGDLMVVHFRRTLDELNHAQLRVSHSRFHEFLEPTHSYVSVVELGLYEASVKLYTELTTKGLQPGSAEWNQRSRQNCQAAAGRGAASLAGDSAATVPLLLPDEQASRRE